MANRIVTDFERGARPTTVNDIEHIESQSLRRRRRHQGVLPAGREDRSGGGADHRDLADRRCGSMPPGTTPPFIITYNASTVPILQLALSGSRTCPSSSSTTSASTSSARSWRRCRARRSRCPTAASSAQIQVDLDPRGAAGQGPRADRRRQRDQRAEPDPARRHGEDRRHANTTSS